MLEKLGRFTTFSPLRSTKASNNGLKDINMQKEEGPPEYVMAKASSNVQPILDEIDIENFEFDPHLHSSLSDGVKTTYDAIALASNLGLKGIAFAEHHRDELHDVLLYNDDGYRLVELEGDDRLSANMDIIDDVFIRQKEDLERERKFNPRSGKPDHNYEIRDLLLMNDLMGQDGFSETDRKLFSNWETDDDNVDLFKSIERDYETWNDQKTEQFLDENEFDHVVLSTHYMPEKFVAANMHEKQTQYLRKADLQHLEDSTEYSIDDVVDWYEHETKAKLLRTADLTNLSDSEAEQLYEQHDVEPSRPVEELKDPIAGDTPVIHSHWDLIATSPYLRPHLEEDHLDRYLDLAERLDQIVEINGRTIMKQRRTYAEEDNFYAPEDAEWFGRKVIERAEEGDLSYVVSSDAHSEYEMIKQYAMLDSLLERTETSPLGLDMYIGNSRSISTV